MLIAFKTSYLILVQGNFVLPNWFTLQFVYGLASRVKEKKYLLWAAIRHRRRRGLSAVPAWKL